MTSCNSDQEQIHELEKKADEYQAQQKLGDSLNVLEEVLNRKREVFGEESEQYKKTCEKLCEICNIIAMIFLNKDKTDSCYDFLKKAEILSQGSALYKAITFNNMAQYCKKTNKIKTGIQYLQKALEIQLKQGNPVLLADTHLNSCALLSQQDKHSEALEHILIAVVLLQDEYSTLLLKKLQTQDASEKGVNKAEKDQNTIKQDSSDNLNKEKNEEEANEDLFSKLAIAYHNMGVEFEFLKRFEESLQTYEKAVTFSKVNLGAEHSLTKQFEIVWQSAQKTISDSRYKEELRKKPNPFRTTHASTVYGFGEKKPQTSSSKTNLRSNAMQVNQTGGVGLSKNSRMNEQASKNNADSNTNCANNENKSKEQSEEDRSQNIVSAQQ